jgi:hypothetical protein
LGIGKETIMAETTTTPTYDATTFDALVAEWVGVSDPRETTLVQCRVAYQAVGHLDGAPRNDAAKDFAQRVSVAMASMVYSGNAALAERMAITSVQQGGQQISHTAVLHRSMAFALASVVGTPTPDSIMIANRLAANTKKGAADEKARILAEGTDVYGDDLEKFSQEIQKSLDTVAEKNKKGTGTPTPNAGVEFNVSILLDALTWASKNPDAFKADDVSDDMRASLAAGARDVIKFTK